MDNDRICKLYDGGWWSQTKSTKAKGRKIDNARLSTLLFTTPSRLISDIWRKVVAFEDGLAERFLITYAERERKTTPEVEAAKEYVRTTSHIKNLHNVYTKIYMEHEEQREYSLNAEAKERITKYLDEHESAGSAAKLEKNTLKHVSYSLPSAGTVFLSGKHSYSTSHQPRYS